MKNGMNMVNSGMETNGEPITIQAIKAALTGLPSYPLNAAARCTMFPRLPYLSPSITARQMSKNAAVPR